LIKKDKRFSKIASIQLVSFKYDKTQGVEQKMPLSKGVPDLNKMFEKKELDAIQFERALDVLFNYQNQSGIRSVSACYEPRNGVILYDKKGKYLGYIELCFTCSRYQIAGKDLKSILPSFCLAKWDALYSIFRVQESLMVCSLGHSMMTISDARQF
jgi:hypothetical protein